MEWDIIHFYLEPALVLMFSDGCSQMDMNGIISEISFPTHDLLPGGELTKEPYRWDQRLFCLNLKIPGYASCITDIIIPIEAEDKPLSNLCDQTGGKLYSIGTHKYLMQSLESIAQKIMVPGVIIQFEKYGEEPDILPSDTNPSNLKEEIPPKKDENIIPLSEKNVNELPRANLNGFISKLPEAEMNGDLKKEFLANGYMENEDQSNKKGLLPTPMLPPNMPPMFPPPPFLRGLLPTPPPMPVPPHALLPPPPAPPHFLNQVMPNNSENQIPMVTHDKMNGSINGTEHVTAIKIKTEGQTPSPIPVLENPVRGDIAANLLPGATRSNVASPNIPQNVSNAWHVQKRMIFVRSNIKGGTVGHWPIPENFWPDSSMVKLPPRDCHPIVRFQCKACDAMVIDHMPFDKYELEPSPLTQYILERKQPYVAWQAFISGSSPTSEIGYPFGYLKASTNLQCVNLFVLPYNYPVVMPLLDELFKIHKCKPTPKWREAFDDYLQKLPSYYIVPLRTALRRMGAPNNLMPEHMDGSLSYAVSAYLKKVKQQAKIEAERLINYHSQPYIPPNVHMTLPLAPQLTDGKTRDFKDLLIQKDAKALNDAYSRRIHHTDSRSSTDGKDLFTSRLLPHPTEKFQVRSYKNPFDIRRGDLIDQVDRMRTNFYHSTILCCKVRDEDSIHHISIAQMGKYEDLTNQIKPLRDLDQTQVRVHTFGNPFKLKQDQNVIFAVDEADVSENLAFNNNQKNRKRTGEQINPYKGVKRKRNETPPPSRRAFGPPNTPPPSPVPFQSTITSNDIENKLKTKVDSKSENDEKLVRKESEKNSTSVNQQLRKLQLLHRNKKSTSSTNERLLASVQQEKTESESVTGDSSSPILSILRTSLEDIEEKDNEELIKINNNEPIKSKTENKKSSRPNSSVLSSNIDPAPNINPIKFEDLSTERLRNARLELTKRSVIRLRMAIWRAIRIRADFPVIESLIRQLEISDDAKYIFISDAIEEVNRFQDDKLSAKLKLLLPNLFRHKTR